MEILAPAGTPELLYAAVEAGADAVYLGGKLFSARRFAGNFTNEEMAADFQTHWAVTTPAVLKVKKPGGLAQGYHDLKYGFCFTSSYMPPIIQSNLDPDQESMIFMPEFGHHVNERRLLIV